MVKSVNGEGYKFSGESHSIFIEKGYSGELFSFEKESDREKERWVCHWSYEPNSRMLITNIYQTLDKETAENE